MRQLFRNLTISSFRLIFAGFASLVSVASSHADCVCAELGDIALDAAQFESATFQAVKASDNTGAQCAITATRESGQILLGIHSEQLPNGVTLRTCYFDNGTDETDAHTESLNSQNNTIQCAVSIENFARRLIQSGVTLTTLDRQPLSVGSLSGRCVSAVARDG